jgi:outer membrane immunogenic protein
MMKLALAATAVAFTGAAYAADMPLKAPAAPLAVYDWSGVYVGANAGYGWADTGWNFPVAQFFASAASQNFSTHLTGAMTGGQIGINRQVEFWVFGVEFTGDWADLNQTLVGPVTPAFPFDAWTTKVKDVETLTARFGYAMNNWLYYGKAGGASGTVNLHALSGLPVPGVSFDQTQRLWGTTLGGGIEYGLTSNIILGVEYDFVRLSNGSINGMASNGGLVTVGGKSALDVQSVLGRVSYKF